jgi:photosystem II stability/assembly factor-like uncharacterized protein
MGESMQHIHGLGVRDGTLYIATHTGLWAASSGQRKPRRVGPSRQDIMGFSVLDRGRFVGSGHPGPDQGNLPPNLGLIESSDGGRSWSSVSLLAKADFHVLRSAGQQIYGINSADGFLFASSDGGRSWRRYQPPGGVYDLAIDPRSPRTLLASTDRGVFESRDGGQGWRALRGDLAGLLAWPAARRLYLVAGDGGVQVSADGGRQWRAVGSVGGQPVAFVGAGADLYAALADSTVKRSVDGGRSWTVRAAP